MKKVRGYAQPLSLLLLGVALGAGGVFATRLGMRSQNDPLAVSRLGGYQLINPLLSCDIGEDTPSAKLASLKNSLSSEAASLKASGKVQRISVYFRDMDYGDWTGVDENALFAPASLMKVPLMIAYLNQVRDEPNLLSKEYVLDVPRDTNEDESFRPVHALQIGQSYSVTDLLRAMIENSDNNATAVLLAHVSKPTFADVFDAFGVPSPNNQNDDTVSPKEYMRFFRIIYNSTYLGRIRSVTALDMLSKVDFPSGLLSGIPQNVPLANKFGERTVRDTNGTIVRRELSDCGIVYYPHSPYGICVMAEGNDFGALSEAIADISQITYKAVDRGILRN